MSTTMKMSAAVRNLCQYGEKALKPTLQDNGNKWRKPAVSKRVAAVLRKQAKRDGLYGSFDATTGQGWDSTWDVNNNNNSIGQVGTMQLRAPKLTTRQRTRQERAQKIEGLLETMDEKINDYHLERQEAKPERSFENHFKRLMRKK